MVEINPNPIQSVTEPCKHLGGWTQKAQTKRGYKMDAKCKLCGLVREDIFPATTFEGFIRRWIAGKLTDKKGKRTITQTRCGNYKASDTKLYYLGAGRNLPVGEDALAIKLPDGRLIGNASKLTRCGSYRRGAESPAQRVMQELEIALIPFNVFEEAKLNLRTAKVIEQGKPEELTVPRMTWDSYIGGFHFMEIWKTKQQKGKPDTKDKVIKDLVPCDVWSSETNQNIRGWQWKELEKSNLEERHFIGAMLLEVSKKYYLFDVDRRELTFWRFNAFLSEIPKPVKTIAQAYDSLIPDKVRKAQKEGKKVLRQGEWFFIPSKLPGSIPASKRDHKIGANEPEGDSFDLRYYPDNNFEIPEEKIKQRLSEIKPKYHKGHLARVADFRRALKEFVNARKRLAREAPIKFSIRGELRAKNNRPNWVDKLVKLPEGDFVSGMVTHSGREHEPLLLKGWYIAVPNTAIASFQITGAID
jgi:hypothetical protein